MFRDWDAEGMAVTRNKLGMPASVLQYLNCLPTPTKLLWRGGEKNCYGYFQVFWAPCCIHSAPIPCSNTCSLRTSELYLWECRRRDQRTIANQKDSLRDFVWSRPPALSLSPRGPLSAAESTELRVGESHPIPHAYCCFLCFLLVPYQKALCSHKSLVKGSKKGTSQADSAVPGVGGQSKALVLDVAFAGRKQS